jgi:hypothetical protein
VIPIELCWIYHRAGKGAWCYQRAGQRTPAGGFHAMPASTASYAAPIGAQHLKEVTHDT